jgi:hypothetical protein
MFEILIVIIRMSELDIQKYKKNSNQVPKKLGIRYVKN